MIQQRGTPQQMVPPIPWLLMTESDVRSSQTQLPVFRIAKSTAPGSWSKNSLVTVTHADTGAVLGTARYRSLEDYVEISINDQMTKLKEDGFFNFHYSLNPTFLPDTEWNWAENDDKGLKLRDGKKGSTIASIISNMLVIDQSNGLTAAAVEEIVLSAVAIAEEYRREKKETSTAEGIGNLAGVLGNVSS